MTEKKLLLFLLLLLLLWLCFFFGVVSAAVVGAPDSEIQFNNAIFSNVCCALCTSNFFSASPFLLFADFMLCASCFSGGRCIGSLSPNLWTPHLQSAQTQLPHSLICLSTHSNTNGKCAATHTKLMCSSFAGCPKSSTLSWPEQCCCVARPSQSYSFTSCGGNATKRK